MDDDFILDMHAVALVSLRNLPENVRSGAETHREGDRLVLEVWASGRHGGMSTWNLKVSPTRDWDGFSFPAEIQFHGQITAVSAEIVAALSGMMPADRRTE